MAFDMTWCACHRPAVIGNQCRGCASGREGMTAPRARTWRESLELSRLWPTCCVCGDAVERFEAERDPLRFEVRYTAICHGEREHVVVRDLIGSPNLLPGVAFVRPELEA